MTIQNNYDKFIELREKYPNFIYKKFSIEEDRENIEVTYNFVISDDINFRPMLRIPKKNFKFKIDINDKRLNNIIFHIGLIELISYWKCVCSPKVVIEAGFLDEEQKQWWGKLYFNGLGEFFYVNSINTNVDDFMEIEVRSSNEFSKQKFDMAGNNLIPIGGGKDSLVTLELLSGLKSNNSLLIINPRGATIDGALAGGYTRENILEVNRTIDKKLLELNAQGFLNGHTPFSALLGFISVFCAILLGSKYIVLSNELSANESTVENSNVNHQYSKSFEFEKDFNRYVEQYITGDIYYFSLLRPFTELKIAQLFSQHKKYFGVFKSCNAGSKTDIWCGKCAKCLFVYIILAPFVDEDELVNIFGSNILDNKNLLEVFDQLVGKEKVKPFECVGTRDEVNAALSNLISKYGSRKLPYLLEYYKRELGSYIKSYDEIDMYLEFCDSENLIPESFKSIVESC